MHDCAYFDSVGRLAWHGDLIPQDEIWVKLGGDKGGEELQNLPAAGEHLPPKFHQEHICVFGV